MRCSINFDRSVHEICAAGGSLCDIFPLQTGGDVLSEQWSMFPNIRFVDLNLRVYVHVCTCARTCVCVCVNEGRNPPSCFPITTLVHVGQRTSSFL